MEVARKEAAPDTLNVGPLMLRKHKIPRGRGLQRLAWSGAGSRTQFVRLYSGNF